MRILLTAVAMLYLAGCGEAPPPAWHEADGYRWRELRVAGGAAGFRERPGRSTGIDFVNDLTQAHFLANRHTVNGSGVAAGDVDGDGRPDLYFARLDGPNVLYRNLGGWQFEDVTDSAGVAAPDRFSTGAALADLDGDGDLDLLVTALGGPNAAFENDGTGRFHEITEAAGLASAMGATTMTLADVEGDGDLDLYVGNYREHTVKDLFPPHVREFDRTVVRNGDAYELVPEFQEHYRLVVQGNRLMRFEVAEPDRFYLNDGTGRFEEVDFTAGTFLDEDGQPLAEAPRDWALTARFHDADDDGDPDLYVANDFESPDHFWINDGTGRFRAAPRLALRKTSNATMSVAFSDVDRDGDTDFFLTDMRSRDYRRRQAQQPSRVPVPTYVGEIDNRPQEAQNTLFLNRGDGTYAEAARLAGLDASEWSWAAAFLDVDLDGFEDLLVTTGHAYDAMNADALERVAMTPVTPQWREVLLQYPPLDLRNEAFRNTGEALRFEPAPDAWRLGTRPDVAHGLALADLDGDGDLDAVTNRLNGPAGLFENTTDAPRLAVRLRGRPPNPDGIGARITVAAPGLPVQTREIAAGGQYLSSDEPLATFATGAADSLVIEVVWRSGRRSRLDAARPNRLYEISEPEAAPRPMAECGWQMADCSDAKRLDVPVRFEAAGERLGHRHTEAGFDDFGRQPLLPYRLSQEGPPVLAGDFDGDGAADLVLGSGRTGRLALFFGDGAGGFRRVEGPEAVRGDQVGLALIRRVVGPPLLAVAVSNYEMPPAPGLPGRPGRPDSSFVELFEITRTGLRLQQRLGLGPESAGPLAAADLDGDGDDDLLAAGRSVPGRYGAPAPARLFRQDDAGRLLRDEAASAPFAEAGLVTEAVLADLDGDGDADVLLATEWGPLRYFENDGAGRFAERTEAVGLAAQHGLWQSLAVGDVDGDGRPDVVAGNWGWNGRHGRLAEGADRPLRLWRGDFDGNGTEDVFEARYEPTLDGYAPVHSLSYLSYAMPGIRRRVRTFEQFANTPLGDLLGPRLAQAPMLEVTTLASTLFLRRGDGYEARPLPLAAQLAPAMAATLDDFDGDGRLDVFLAQNFFATSPETPRLDAGRGLLLLNAGDGTFEAVEQAGLEVYGEQRATASEDFDGDGRPDLVVTQNGAATHLYLNRPGSETP